MRNLRNRALGVLRAFAACALILACSTVAGADASPAAAAAPGRFTYIVVLHDRPPKGAPAEPGEPDISGMGGEVLDQWHNRRVVRMPEAAVRALVAHRGVKYIQRVQTAGGLPGMPRSETTAITSDVETQSAPPTWFSGEYVYDGEGNITQIATSASPNSDGGTDVFGYDSAGRLVSAAMNHGSARSEQYSYDSFGNLVQTARTAGPSTATPVDAGTNRLQGVTYDSVGNVTATEGDVTQYIYDGLNMLRAKETLGGMSMYVYTADDERIGVLENGEQRWMIRDLDGRVLREWEGYRWWVWREDYVYRGGVLAAAEREPTEAGTRHFHLDHLGTPRLLTDSDGAKIALHDYFPFGVESTDFRQEMLERGTDRPEPMKFTGHERDFTGGIESDNRNQLDYMHARYYSPVWGRFLSVDPVSGDVFEPQSWNGYAYASNNPVMRIDPDGRADRLPSDADQCGSADDPCNIDVPIETDPLPLPDDVIRWLDERWHAVANMRSPTTGLTLRDQARANANFLVGFGDASSAGVTALLRDEEDAQNVDSDSSAYTAGIVAGIVNSYAYNRLGFTRGHEFTRNAKVFRVAPWGNRTGHPTGRYPHYHARRLGPNGQTRPGGSIKRHRPSDPPVPGQPWWSRF